MLEARNLRSMTVQQTPLLGDENTPLHVSANGGTGFEGATPRHQAAFTPNPLATPMHDGDELGPGATPRAPSASTIGATPLRTPRDNLSINADGTMTGGETPRDERARASSAKRALQAGFSSLPKPENNFELLMPEDEDEDEDGMGGTVQLSEEDAEERDARIRKTQEKERLKVLARRSQVVQRELPRPPNVDVEVLMQRLDLNDEADQLSAACQLIHAEMASLLKHDSIAHPIPGTTTAGGTLSEYDMPHDLHLLAAKNHVLLELATAIGFPDATEEQIRQSLIATAGWDDVDDSEMWSKKRPSLVLDVKSGIHVSEDSLTAEERVAGYTALLGESRETMSKEASKAGKMEKKLGVTLGGYQVRASVLGKRIIDAFAETQAAKIDLEAFLRLQANENVTGPARVAALREEVNRLESKERNLQARYAELDAERRNAQTRVEVMEERIMAEAEALNDAALAEMDG
jgi:pre-mRNA-splicing factor CDC5/CEF1